MKRKPCKRLTGWRYWAERLLGLRAQRLSELLEQRRRPRDLDDARPRGFLQERGSGITYR